MTERGLREAVRLAAQSIGSADEAAIDEAVRLFGSPEAREILVDDRGAVAKLGAMAVLLTANSRAIENDAQADRTTSSMRKTTPAERLALIEYDVVEVRTRIFGTQKPPFSTYDPDALGWLYGNAFVGFLPPISAVQDPRAGVAVDEWFDLGIPDHYRDYFEFSYEPRVLPFYDPQSGTIRKLEVGYRTALDFLRWFLREAEEVTRIPQSALLVLVLTGARPIVPRWQVIDRRLPETSIVSEPFLEDGDNHEEHGPTRQCEEKPLWSEDPHPFAVGEGWDIRINVSDYRGEDHRQIYKTIQEMRGPRSEILDDKDRTLIDVIREEGGLPPKGARGNGQFWQRVQKRCMERGIESFGSSSAPRKRAERLVERGYSLSTQDGGFSLGPSFKWWRDRSKLGREPPPLEGDWRQDKPRDELR